jgi:hypothetical protein
VGDVGRRGWLISKDCSDIEVISIKWGYSVSLLSLLGSILGLLGLSRLSLGGLAGLFGIVGGVLSGLLSLSFVSFSHLVLVRYECNQSN